MKKSRRIICVILCALMSLHLYACDSDEREEHIEKNNDDKITQEVINTTWGDETWENSKSETKELMVDCQIETVTKIYENGSFWAKVTLNTEQSEQLHILFNSELCPMYVTENNNECMWEYFPETASYGYIENKKYIIRDENLNVTGGYDLTQYEKVVIEQTSGTPFVIVENANLEGRSVYLTYITSDGVESTNKWELSNDDYNKIPVNGYNHRIAQNVEVTKLIGNCYIYMDNNSGKYLLFDLDDKDKCLYFSKQTPISNGNGVWQITQLDIVRFNTIAETPACLYLELDGIRPNILLLSTIDDYLKECKEINEYELVSTSGSLGHMYSDKYAIPVINRCFMSVLEYDISNNRLHLVDDIKVPYYDNYQVKISSYIGKNKSNYYAFVLFGADSKYYLAIMDSAGELVYEPMVLNDDLILYDLLDDGNVMGIECSEKGINTYCVNPENQTIVSSSEEDGLSVDYYRISDSMVISHNILFAQNEDGNIRVGNINGEWIESIHANLIGLMGPSYLVPSHENTTIEECEKCGKISECYSYEIKKDGEKSSKYLCHDCEKELRNAEEKIMLLSQEYDTASNKFATADEVYTNDNILKCSLPVPYVKECAVCEEKKMCRYYRLTLNEEEEESFICGECIVTVELGAAILGGTLVEIVWDEELQGSVD